MKHIPRYYISWATGQTLFSPGWTFHHNAARTSRRESGHNTLAANWIGSPRSKPGIPHEQELFNYATGRTGTPIPFPRRASAAANGGAVTLV